MARLDVQSVLEPLVSRVRSIELTDEPRRHLNNTIRAWGTLPLRLTVA